MLRLLRVFLGVGVSLAGIGWSVVTLLGGQSAFALLGCTVVQIIAAVLMPSDMLEGG